MSGVPVKRNGAVGVFIVLFVAALFWAGVHNVRRRRAEEARVREQQAALIPDLKPGQASPTAGDDDVPDLRGKQAAGFTLTTLDGKKVSLADYKGRPVLLNFWATWCAPCKVEMPWFEEFNKKYAGQNLAIVGITEDAVSKDEIAKAVQKTGVTYPILLTDSKVDSAYGAVNYLPTSFYIDRTGKIVAQTAGLGGKDDIETNLKKIVSE